MSDENIIRVVVRDDGTVWQEMPDGTHQPYSGPETDWDRVNAMTDEELEANALSDPDNPPITDEEFKFFMRVPDPKRIRQKLGLTQREFASTFRLSLGALRDWEQGAAYPDRAALQILRVIDTHPEAVLDAIRQYSPYLESDNDEPTGDDQPPVELNQPAPAARRYRSAG